MIQTVRIYFRLVSVVVYSYLYMIWIYGLAIVRNQYAPFWIDNKQVKLLWYGVAGQLYCVPTLLYVKYKRPPVVGISEEWKPLLGPRNNAHDVKWTLCDYLKIMQHIRSDTLVPIESIHYYINGSYKHWKLNNSFSESQAAAAVDSSAAAAAAGFTRAVSAPPVPTPGIVME